MSRMIDVKYGIEPCDILQIPVYASYRTDCGIAADKLMFRNSGIIILRYVGDDGKSHDILVTVPAVFCDGMNYYDADTKEWAYA